jgi:hypothetical protein
MDSSNYYQTAPSTPPIAPEGEEIRKQPATQPTAKPPKLTTKTASNRKKSSNLKLNADTQKQLHELAEKCGLTQSAYITVLITRNAEGADKTGFEREVANAKKYLS